MKNRKINVKNKKLDLLSLNFRYCSLAFKDSFPKVTTKLIKLPANNTNFSIQKPYPKPLQLFRTGWTTLNQGGLDR